MVAALCAAAGCAEIKQMGLYDQESTTITPNIKGYEALSIYNDQMSGDLWFTQSPSCVMVRSASDSSKSGNGNLSIEWNKQAGDCPWLGMGIGWNNWTGKDFSQIINDAALSFWVRTKGGVYKGLPWAVGFEDFSGGQAWTGLTSNLVQGGAITEEWTQMIVPLSNFPFEAYDVDVTAIKQIIFQFESNGKVFMDEVSIIPHQYRGRQIMEISKSAHDMQNDLSIPWHSPGVQISDSKLLLNFDDQNLYIAAKVVDDTPAINAHSNENIWNGDAIELAFGTEDGVDPKRRIYYSTDRHIGIGVNEKPLVYDWTSGRVITQATVNWNPTEGGYVLNATIPWSAINAKPWESGKTYGLEVALDMGNEKGVRTEQLRWNSQGMEGFNFNPSLWGELKISSVNKTEE